MYVYPPVQPQESLASSASGWIAANPITSCAAMLGLVYVAKNGGYERLSALAVSGLAGSKADPRADVEMNTKYQKSIFDAVGRKKDKSTGDSANLKGYTVGSRAPPRARASGETVNPKFGYGIDNLYGGKKNVQQVKAKDSKGVIQADAGGTLGKIGVIWAGLVGLYLLSNIGGGN
jgi:hypothetical protein